MQTLYRKYRPQTFADLTGQDHIKITLENEIIAGKVAHAYLFCGPRGIGKTTSARLLAKAVNCQNRAADSSEPCNQCDACREITEGRAMDVIEMDAASNTGVDNVRENIIENVRVLPSRLKYKIFIIDEAHMLSAAAFNALLKTLEEPPPRVIFILATTETHKVPATIISRCQRFDFKKIRIADLAERLNHLAASEGIEVDRKVLERVARESEGCLRDAESLLGQIFSVGGKKIDADTAELFLPASDFSLVFSLIKHLARKDASEAVKFINQITSDGLELNRFAADLIDVLRKMLLFKIDEPLADLSLEYDDAMESEFREIAAKFKIEEVLKMIDVFLVKKQELKTSAIPQFPLELAAVELCCGAVMENIKSAAPSIKLPPINANTVFIKKDAAAEPVKKSEIETPAAVLPPVFSGGGEPLNLNIETIKEHWDDVISKISDYNASFPITVRLSRPLAITGNTLNLGTNFKFHKERLGELKNKMLLEKVLEEMFGARIMISAEVVKDEETIKAEEVRGAAENLAEEFGGRVV